MNPGEHVIQSLWAAKLKREPYRHIYATGVMPEDEYERIRAGLPAEGGLQVGNYDARRIFRHDVAWMLAPEFARGVFVTFGLDPDRRKDARIETRVTRDRAGYGIGPHTDGWNKIATLLFYMPADDRDSEHGTSVYQPKEKGYTCNGVPHHPFGNFDRVWTAPYVPNSCFGFVRSGESFHGVEPVRTMRAADRPILIWNAFHQ